MKPIIIVGGGLAGLTLGILLRRENVPVTIHEASRYPRHRVCGEFISGEGQRILREVGGASLAAREATATSIFLGTRMPIRFEMKEAAICSSRFELDACLAGEFQKRGGDLRTNSRYKNGEIPGLVHASGRRRADPAGGHLLGLKAHATGVQLAADMELHFAPNRYVGICRLPGDRVNVCGLFYSLAPIADLQSRWRELLSESSPALREANWMQESFCAVAGITLDRNFSGGRFAIGDAAAMIAPLTGNGMSMAFESAVMASKTLLAYARGMTPWEKAMRDHARDWKRAFVPRLRWANFTQRLAFDSRFQPLFFVMAKTFPALPRMIFNRTR